MRVQTQTWPFFNFFLLHSVCKLNNLLCSSVCLSLSQYCCHLHAAHCAMSWTVLLVLLSKTPAHVTYSDAAKYGSTITDIKVVLLHCRLYEVLVLPSEKENWLQNIDVHLWNCHLSRPQRDDSRKENPVLQNTDLAAKL